LPSLPSAILSATCGSIFDPARLHRELDSIGKKLEDPALWSNPAASQPLMRDRKRLETLIADDDALVSRLGDIEA
jgi:peptide chain release factor 2